MLGRLRQRILAVEDAYLFVLASRSKGEAVAACHFQGDNLAIAAYFAGCGRVRRAGLARRFQHAWDRLGRRSRRSANTVADRLAGDALKAAKLMLRRHDNPGSVCYVSLYDAPFEVMPTAMTLVADLSDFLLIRHLFARGQAFICARRLTSLRGRSRSLYCLSLSPYIITLLVVWLPSLAVFGLAYE